MNILPGEVQGNQLRLADHSLVLERSYADMSGNIEIGIRPEFIRIASAQDVQQMNFGHGVDSSAAIPMQVNSVENIGRHQIVRGTISGISIDAVVDEGSVVPAEAFAVFDTSRLNVYQNSHLVRARD